MWSKPKEDKDLSWDSIKAVIEAVTGLDRDALHIYAAFLIQIAAAAFLRRPLANLLPWICVLAFAIGNELLDIYSDTLVEEWELKGGAHDLWNTMIIPTALLLLLRFAPGVAVRTTPPRECQCC